MDRALETLAPDAGTLEAARALRRVLSPDAARRALELRELRRRALGRLPIPDRLILTPKGLMQATRLSVATARAERIAVRMPGALVLDSTAGIGADSLALAARQVPLLSADIDKLHATCTRENLSRAGFPARVVIADAAHPPAKPDVLVIDPDRRQGDRRILDPERWSPGLSRCIELAGRVRGACLKLAPSLDIDRIPGLPAGLPHSWQWTSADGELVEVTLWTGELAARDSEREVQLLSDTGLLARFCGSPIEDFHLPVDRAQRIAWLCEPDPALIRSGLLTRFAREQDLSPIGPAIAYLGASREPAPSALHRCWRVLASETVDRRRIRALLRAHDIGDLVVKKRGHPRSAAELARAFRGKGSRRGTLIVTRLERGHRAYLVEQMDSARRPPGSEKPENSSADPSGRLVGDEGFEPPTSSL